MPFRYLLAVGVAILGTSAAACSDDGEDAVPLTTTTSSTTPTTRASTTSTTLDFETEVKLAALELLEIRNDVLQNPDVSRVSEYISEFCTCLERELGIVEEFVQSGRRWTGPAVEPLGLRVDRSDADNPTFTLIARQPAGAIVSASNEEPVPEVPLAPYFLSLIRDETGGWRFNGLQGIPTMQASVARAIIEEEGLP